MKIMILCFGGWSSSLLGKKIETGLADRGRKASVTTCSVELGLGQMKSFDVILIAPQVRHMAGPIREAGAKTGTPVLELSMDEYSGKALDKLLDRLIAAAKLESGN